MALFDRRSFFRKDRVITHLRSCAYLLQRLEHKVMVPNSKKAGQPDTLYVNDVVDRVLERKEL